MPNSLPHRNRRAYERQLRRRYGAFIDQMASLLNAFGRVDELSAQHESVYNIASRSGACQVRYTTTA